MRKSKPSVKYPKYRSVADFCREAIREKMNRELNDLEKKINWLELKWKKLELKLENIEEKI